MDTEDTVRNYSSLKLTAKETVEDHVKHGPSLSKTIQESWDYNQVSHKIGRPGKEPKTRKPHLSHTSIEADVIQWWWWWWWWWQ